MSPELLFSTALGYFLAAKRLVDCEEHNDSGPLAPAIYMMLGFVVELQLKAFLAHRGLDDAALRRISHDLPAAYQAALANGFPRDIPIANLVDGLAEPHRQHSFRYMVEADIELPLIDPMMPWFEECLDRVGGVLGLGPVRGDVTAADEEGVPES